MVQRLDTMEVDLGGAGIDWLYRWTMKDKKLYYIRPLSFDTNFSLISKGSKNDNIFDSFSSRSTTFSRCSPVSHDFPTFHRWSPHKKNWNWNQTDRNDNQVLVKPIKADDYYLNPKSLVSFKSYWWFQFKHTPYHKFIVRQLCLTLSRTEFTFVYVFYCPVLETTVASPVLGTDNNYLYRIQPHRVPFRESATT